MTIQVRKRTDGLIEIRDSKGYVLCTLTMEQAKSLALTLAAATNH